MSDETYGREDAAQDAEACAEALESLDRIALDELSFSDSVVDAQDEVHEDTEDEGGDAKDAPDEAEEDDSEADDQPESDTGEETVLLDSLPAEDSLTRELPGLGSAPAVDETIAMGDIPLPSVPSAHEAEVRHRKMSPKRRNLMVAGVVAVALGRRRCRLCCLERISARAGCRCRRQCPHDDVGADWRACRGPRLFRRLQDSRTSEWPGF